MQKTKDSIVLALDDNDTRDKNSDSYGKLIEDMDLIPAIDLEKTVPSTFKGKRIIDHRETYGILPSHISKRGKLPKVQFKS